MLSLPENLSYCGTMIYSLIASSRHLASRPQCCHGAIADLTGDESDAWHERARLCAPPKRVAQRVEHVEERMLGSGFGAHAAGPSLGQQQLVPALGGADDPGL